MIQTTSPETNPLTSNNNPQNNATSPSDMNLIPAGTWRPHLRLGRKRLKLSYGTNEVTLADALKDLKSIFPQFRFMLFSSYSDGNNYVFYFEIAETIPENQITRWVMIEECFTEDVSSENWEISLYNPHSGQYEIVELVQSYATEEEVNRMIELMFEDQYYSQNYDPDNFHATRLDDENTLRDDALLPFGCFNHASTRPAEFPYNIIAYFLGNDEFLHPPSLHDTASILHVRTRNQLLATFDMIKTLVQEYSLTFFDFDLWDLTSATKTEIIETILAIVGEVDSLWEIMEEMYGEQITDNDIHLLSHDLDVILNPLAYDVAMYKEIGILNDSMFDEARLLAYWKVQKNFSIEVAESSETISLQMANGFSLIWNLAETRLDYVRDKIIQAELLEHREITEQKEQHSRMTLGAVI